MKRCGNIRLLLQLSLVSLCLVEPLMHSQSELFRLYDVALFLHPWILHACLAVWCGTFLFLTFSQRDFLLIFLLLAAMGHLICYTAWCETDVIAFLTGITLGKGARCFLINGGDFKLENCGYRPKDLISKSRVLNFLVAIVVLLVFSSWWHLDTPIAFYHGLRWMGIWNNPNDYGMLMSVGVLLSFGLFANLKWEIANVNSAGRMQKLLTVALLVAAFMMGVGSFFSYSRGAWVGTAIGLLYLSNVHWKCKWKCILPVVFLFRC